MIRFVEVRTTEAIMAAKEISVKKYVVRLSADERERLEALIRKGKSPAQQLLKARILLQADHRGSGNQRVRGLPGAQATGGRRLRGRVEPQTTGDAGGRADFRRREGSRADRLGLLQTSQGTRALDL